MITEELRKSVMLSAITGNLSIQRNNESVSDEFNDYRETFNFNIPSNWKCVKLSDITDYGKNNSLIGKNIADEEWILELEDIEKDSGILLKKVRQQVRKSVSNKNRFRTGDLLYGKLRPYLNKCIIADEDGYCSTEIVPMSLNHNVINKYLQIVLMSPYFLNYVNEKSYGTKMPRLGTRDAQNSIIPLPPLEEQQRIVDKIEIIFTKLDEIKPIEEELMKIKNKFPDDMQKSLLSNLFFGKASFIIESYENWKSDTLMNIADICTGNSISETLKKNKYTNIEHGYNYIATKDLSFEHTFNYDNGVKIPYSEVGFKYANSNDILMCIEGGSAGKKIGILDKTVCYGNKLCKFSLKTDSIIPKFLYYYLQSEVFLKNFYENLNGIIGGVSINKIKKIIIKYPSIKEQERIVDKLEKLLPLCDDISDLTNQ